MPPWGVEDDVVVCAVVDPVPLPEPEEEPRRLLSSVEVDGLVNRGTAGVTEVEALVAGAVVDGRDSVNGAAPAGVGGTAGSALAPFL